MEGYNVKIAEASKELTARERLALKDTSKAVKLDDALNHEDSIVITPAMFAVLDVHNEKSENKDYEVYIIVDKDGTKYMTGSASFWTSFIEIWEEMAGEDEEYSIEAYKKDSKNYTGKQFLTCSIV